MTAIYAKDNAPEGSRELLANAEKAYGFLPNLLGVLAASPAALRGYMTIGQIFDESDFSPTERNVVLLAVSRGNECRYCVAAHSVIAQMREVPDAVVEAIRTGRPIDDPKLEALRGFVAEVVEKRGWVEPASVAAFKAAGFADRHVLEVVLGVAMKTLSNYVNHLAETPLDEAFAAAEWTP